MSNIFENKGAMAATIVVAASNSLNKGAANYVCDGVADDVEIQAANDALPAGGGTVWLTAGTYNVSASIVLKDFTSLVGEPLYAAHITGGVYLKATAGLTVGLVINKVYFDEGPNPVGRNTTICLRGLDIEMTLAAGIDAVHFEGCNFSAVIDCNIVATGYGVYLKGGIDQFRLSGTTIWSATPSGIYVLGQYIHIYDCIFNGCTYGVNWDAKSGTIEGCSFEAQAEAGIYSTAGALYSRDLTIANNYFTKEAKKAIYLIRALGVTISGNTLSSNSVAGWGTGQDGIYLSMCQGISVVGNIVHDASRSAANTYDGIRVVTSNDCTITGNIVDSPGAFTRFGIYLNDSDRNTVVGNTVRDMVNTGIVATANSDYNIVQGNITLNNAYAIDASSGVGNRVFNNYEDLFMDVLAVSATHVVIAQTLAANPTVCAIAAQPDVPRTLSYTITHPTLTAFTLTFVGVNAKGRIVTEVFTQAAGWTGETGNAFATVTSITMSAMTGNTVADTIDVGITDVLGLSNEIYLTSDVYKIKKNAANALVAVAQVNATYDTYDMVVIGLAVGDDFTIWFRSNLNIIA